MSGTYRVKAKELPWDGGWDVIVIGGGPAGCAAAMGAAAEGAKTLLLESQGCLGGMGTAGLVPAWCPFSDGEKIIYGGFAKNVFLASKKGVPFEPADKLDWVAINPEHLKRVYDEAMEQAGVTVRFFTLVCDVETDGRGRVTAIVTASKEGLRAWSAKAYVDCSGDGDVAARAGAPFELGRPEDQDLQPGTLCFQLGGVDTESYMNGPALHAHVNRNSPIYAAVKSGRYPLIPDEHLCQNTVGPGLVGFNAGHVWEVNNCDPGTLSPAMAKGRRMAEEYRRFLAEMVTESFAHCFVATTGSLLGIRETRRILGEYVLTLDDYLARRSFDDEIARNCYYIDIHASAKPTDGADPKMKTPPAERYRRGESHGIPYRCLVPKSLANVLVAGRCISTDRAVNGSVRVMPTCLVTGEAAGTAAGLSADLGVAVRDVPVHAIRQRLREKNAYLP